MYQVPAERCDIDGTPLVDQSDERLIGTLLERYRILEVIGSGATGCVYRAKHALLDTEYALKVLTAELAHDLRFRERFRREARSASKIRHPNIIRIHDFGMTKDGLNFLVMELVHGETLARAISKDAPFTPQRAASIFRQVLSGLAAAHDLGFVHRDVKPSNVMLVGGDDIEAVKILDFGTVAIRAAGASERRLTATGHIIGTPAYMAPEQCRGEDVGPAADLYAAGVILYEMLVGEPIFPSRSPSEVLLKQVREEPPPAPLSCGLETIVSALLRKEPSARPKDAITVIRMLDDLNLHGRAGSPASEPDDDATDTADLSSSESFDTDTIVDVGVSGE